MIAFKIVGIFLVVLIAAILILAATKPSTLRIARTTQINASPTTIFTFLDDFHKWEVWSPWEKLDTTMTRTFSGPPSGTGSVYSWEGQGKAGAGRMEILETIPSAKLVIKLDFIKPFEGHNQTEFGLEPRDASTLVTWTMAGPSPFISKVMQVFLNLDKPIGKDFETGLANLKNASEA